MDKCEPIRTEPQERSASLVPQKRHRKRRGSIREFGANDDDSLEAEVTAGATIF